MKKNIIIAVDAMGSDHAPQVEVEGALKFVEENKNVEIVLVGDSKKISEYLNFPHERIKIIHTSETIGSDEEPLKAIKTKKTSSMVMALKEVSEKRADAFVTAGNTGAALAGGLFILGRIKGIERPALSPIFPGEKGEFIMLDIGATSDGKAKYLEQYALLGSAYAETRGINNPRVGLLNIGVEETKGDELRKEAYELLQNNKNINFIGNVEARDIFKGYADVIVTDGFSGNVALKVIEGTAGFVMQVLKTNLLSSLKSKILTFLLKKELKGMKKSLDYRETGGTLLIGVNAPLIKAHGSSNSYAFYNALKLSKTVCENNLIEKIKEKLEN
jgi:glycerol-3-phosphate acyltransferase PlsX